MSKNDNRRLTESQRASEKQRVRNKSTSGGERVRNYEWSRERSKKLSERNDE